MESGRQITVRSANIPLALTLLQDFNIMLKYLYVVMFNIILCWEMLREIIIKIHFLQSNLTSFLSGNQIIREVLNDVRLKNVNEIM